MRFHKSQFLPECGNWAELLQAVNDWTERGDRWIFRGLRKGPDINNDLKILSHFDEAWGRRSPKGSASAKPLPRSSRELYEAWMLRDFRRQAYHHLRAVPEREDLLEWLALGRHYGMPVRLVDFTYSFYVAVYFSICRGMGSNDGWILAFNHTWHKAELEKRIVPRLAGKVPHGERAFQDSRLFRAFAVGNRQNYVAAVNPFRRNPRLAAQQGLFLCPANVRHDFDSNLEGALPSDPANRKDRLVLIKVPSRIRTETIRELRRMNISSASLFPDLSGWAESQGDLVHHDMDTRDEAFKRELKLEMRKPR